MLKRVRGGTWWYDPPLGISMVFEYLSASSFNFLCEEIFE